jgi:predicted DNA-binding transcriptional regulator YafY
VRRADRLFRLVQRLRKTKLVTAARLADELEVSERTVYRDVRDLIFSGVPIRGEAGVGYVLGQGFDLPPLMFTEDEIEALVLGTRWVAKRTDAPLSKAARNALAKIVAVLPDDMKDGVEDNGLMVAIGEEIPAGDAELPTIRLAIRGERKLRIAYVDADGKRTSRTIWPFAIGFFDRTRMVAAWCETRKDFRHFRTDRIATLKMTETRYPRRRQVLAKEWREKEGIAPQ